LYFNYYQAASKYRLLMNPVHAGKDLAVGYTKTKFKENVFLKDFERTLKEYLPFSNHVCTEQIQLL